MVDLTEDQLALLPDEADVAFFEQHGWWISPPLLSAEEIEEARFGAERYYSGERDAVLLMEAGTDWTQERGNVLRQNDYVSLQIEELQRLVQSPLIGAAAARLARTSEIRLFHDQLIHKPPEADPDDVIVGWHTDIAYWRTCSSRNLLTAWVPFQTVTDDMGPMLVIDGSHRWPGNDGLEHFHNPDLEAVAREIHHDGAELRTVPLILEAGQVSFHHCRTIHGSQPNQSDRARAALAIHVQDATNRWVAAGADGRRAVHLNDFLCRKDADGNPDYADPEVFPVMYAESST